MKEYWVDGPHEIEKDLLRDLWAQPCETEYREISKPDGLVGLLRGKKKIVKQKRTKMRHFGQNRYGFYYDGIYYWTDWEDV